MGVVMVAVAIVEIADRASTSATATPDADVKVRTTAAAERTVVAHRAMATAVVAAATAAAFLQASVTIAADAMTVVSPVATWVAASLVVVVLTAAAEPTAEVSDWALVSVAGLQVASVAVSQVADSLTEHFHTAVWAVDKWVVVKAATFACHAVPVDLDTVVTESSVGIHGVVQYLTPTRHRIRVLLLPATHTRTTRHAAHVIS